MQPFTKPPCTGSKNWRKFITHTRRQMTVITLVSISPKSSSFWLRGVFSTSSAADCTSDWILPISVAMPVATTRAVKEPLDTVVPAKTMLSLDWIRASGSTGSVIFCTVADSPVSEPSSIRIVVVLSEITRQSAGTLSPTRMSTMSPGTSSLAGSVGCSSPSRITVAVCPWSSLSASSADSAFDSCHTPTTALITRIRRITKGSTKAVMPSSSSKKASTKETIAAARRILTRKSSNCASTSFQSGVGSSLASSLEP
mmetsp:Transcript_5528/g.18717  ORF Transcript_5528/g.18717 Transcript_5528/m.18717 type:complete len:256 (+) Transcript_5528:152-919(+)